MMKYLQRYKITTLEVILKANSVDLQGQHFRAIRVADDSAKEYYLHDTTEIWLHARDVSGLL